MIVKDIAMKIVDDTCKQINAQAEHLRRQHDLVTEKYLTQELLEEVIKILQERV